MENPQDTENPLDGVVLFKRCPGRLKQEDIKYSFTVLKLNTPQVPRQKHGAKCTNQSKSEAALVFLIIGFLLF